MAVDGFSRFYLCETLVDDKDRVYLGDRARYTYRELADNRFHVVAEGDSLFTLAATYFEGLERPAGLFWAIADFQPTPIHDVTIPLIIGQTIVIPSMRTVLEEILSANRVTEFQG